MLTKISQIDAFDFDIDRLFNNSTNLISTLQCNSCNSKYNNRMFERAMVRYKKESAKGSVQMGCLRKH